MARRQMRRQPAGNAKADETLCVAGRILDERGRALGITRADDDLEARRSGYPCLRR
jgi:hypothetical protein